MTKGKRVGVISLGCDKNRIDTEKMLFEDVPYATAIKTLQKIVDYKLF